MDFSLGTKESGLVLLIAFQNSILRYLYNQHILLANLPKHESIEGHISSPAIDPAIRKTYCLSVCYYKALAGPRRKKYGFLDWYVWWHSFGPNSSPRISVYVASQHSFGRQSQRQIIISCAPICLPYALKRIRHKRSHFPDTSARVAA